ncbi:MAG: N(4)-(beta-N-acetylglucosaminyl)-L-asparaginase [Candidatus Aminicenantia bacterium]
MKKFSRRDFLKVGAGFTIGSSLLGKINLFASSIIKKQSQTDLVPVAIASRNGLKATEKAMELLKKGVDPLNAAIAGVNLVEDDPNDLGVGYGGIPNEEGVVELDASVMHGPTHNAGGVASLRNIKNPSKVAKLVMERTDHVLLVGEGALKFAKAHGFKEENLLTDRSREIWLHWKETLSDKDDWFPPKNVEEESERLFKVYGTINCLTLDANSNLAGVTTTSGLYFKIPGRVGDSPIIGAGLYVDNEVGAAGSTGRGEANLLNCGSFTVVEFMRDGYSPEEACLKTLERIANTSKRQPHLLDKNGRPKFGLSFYALNKKGQYGGASMWSGYKLAVHDGKENKLVDCAYLYKKNN